MVLLYKAFDCLGLRVWFRISPPNLKESCTSQKLKTQNLKTMSGGGCYRTVRKSKFALARTPMQLRVLRRPGTRKALTPKVEKGSETI